MKRGAGVGGQGAEAEGAGVTGETGVGRAGVGVGVDVGAGAEAEGAKGSAVRAGAELGEAAAPEAVGASLSELMEACSKSPYRPRCQCSYCA